MRRIIIITILMMLGFQIFSQNFRVEVKVDDFTGDTLKQTKPWKKVAGTGIMEYLKVRAKSINDETLLGFAIGAKYSLFSIERGANILFKMANDEIVPINIDETQISKVGSGFGTELIMYVHIDWKTLNALTGEINIKAIRVVTDRGPINWKVPKENAEIIKRVLMAVD